MNARLTVCIPGKAAFDVLLRSSQTYLLGRDCGADVLIDEPSISRRHATLSFESGAWHIVDENSQNGVYIDNLLCTSSILTHGCVVQLGNVSCRYESLSLSQIEAQEAHDSWRKQQVSASGHSQATLTDLLSGQLNLLLQLTGMERCVLLLGDSLADMRVALSAGCLPQELSTLAFDGSIGAIEQAVYSRQTFISMDAFNHPVLSARSTTRQKNVAATVVVPMLDGNELLGIVYTDSRMAGKLIKDVDMDIIGLLVQQLSANIMTQASASVLEEIINCLQSERENQIFGRSIEELGRNL